MAPQLRKWFAIGSGVGIEFDGEDLLVTAVRVRFERVSLLGEHRITNYASRPAGEWGREYQEFLRRLELTHLAACVVLPREITTVRLLSLPPIRTKEMEAAVRFQTDSLHPYAEEEATYAWTKLARSNDVLVAVSRRQAVERLITLFAEAGIEIASLTVSAAVLYSAIHLFGPPANLEFAAIESTGNGLELYGESSSRAVFSAFVNGPVMRMEAFARSELRLSPDSEVLPLRAMLPTHDASGPDSFVSARSYAAALCAALPWLSLHLNLLPKDLRSSNSKLFYVPTAVLAGLLLICAAALAAENSWEQRQYLQKLNARIAQVQPLAKRAQELDRGTQKALAEARQIDTFRLRSKADLDAVNELTRILQPPAFINGLDLTRSGVQMFGQAQSATGLLKSLDASPFFKNSSFMQALSRNSDGELFHVRVDRQGTE